MAPVTTSVLTAIAVEIGFADLAATPRRCSGVRRLVAGFDALRLAAGLAELRLVADDERVDVIFFEAEAVLPAARFVDGRFEPVLLDAAAVLFLDVVVLFEAVFAGLRFDEVRLAAVFLDALAAVRPRALPALRGFDAPVFGDLAMINSCSVRA